MKYETIVSKCCGAYVVVEGSPDFVGDTGKEHGCTMCYVCLKCNKPCDVIVTKDKK